MLEEVEKALKAYQSRSENIRRMLEGAKGEANLALEAIASAHPQFSRRMPRTWTSYPISVTTEVDHMDGEQLPERYKVIEFQAKPLHRLAVEACRAGIIDTY